MLRGTAQLLIGTGTVAAVAGAGVNGARMTVAPDLLPEVPEVATHAAAIGGAAIALAGIALLVRSSAGRSRAALGLRGPSKAGIAYDRHQALFLPISATQHAEHVLRGVLPNGKLRVSRLTANGTEVRDLSLAQAIEGDPHAFLRHRNKLSLPDTDGRVVSGWRLDRWQTVTTPADGNVSIETYLMASRRGVQRRVTGEEVLAHNTTEIVAPRLARSGVVPNPELHGQAVAWRKPPRSMPLYGRSGAPSPKDVRQGALGDCYLLAGLRQLARTDPEQITKRIIENTDGTISVWFGDDMVTVTRDLPVDERGQWVYSQPSRDGALWVAYVEKAHAARYPNGYKDTGRGGMPYIAFDEFLGSHSRRVPAPDDNLHYLRDMLDEGHSAVVHTRVLDKPLRHPLQYIDMKLHRMIPRHAYELASVRPSRHGTLQARLGNPHGSHHSAPIDEATFRRMIAGVDVPGICYSPAVGEQKRLGVPALVLGGGATAVAAAGAGLVWAAHTGFSRAVGFYSNPSAPSKPTPSYG